jgi:phage tail sheath protein FI
MPITPTYPGVYIQELPSAVRTITGVSTSITAFIGRAKKGPVDEALLIHSFPEYERLYGGLWKESNMSYAVYQYFLNGGKDAVICRVHKNAKKSTFNIGPGLRLEASSPGGWTNQLRIGIGVKKGEDIDEELSKDDETLFKLSIKLVDEKDANKVIETETFPNISADILKPRFVSQILKSQSNLVRVLQVTKVRPPQTNDLKPTTQGDDGQSPTDTEIIGIPNAPKSGLYLLDNADLFNMLCIPPYAGDIRTSFTSSAVCSTAQDYCKKKRAMLIIDSPDDWIDKDKAKNNIDILDVMPARTSYAAIWFPRVECPDPLDSNRVRTFVPCGIVAGLIARIDSDRGVWKAPAGIEATLIGVYNLKVHLTDDDNGDLNPLGINCLRNLPAAGIVAWGARTMRGADRLTDQWKYLPIRRTALYIEETLYRGTQWVVFEPNDEPLWALIRLNVGAFMHDLYRKGAFQGTTPSEAYFVKCDHETTTQYDIDRGIVNIVVGFAPLKPAEFVIISIQQITRQEAQ